MTTIAIDKHGTIAADGMRVWAGEIVGLEFQKVRVRHGRIYALTGTAPLFEPLIRWHHNDKADPSKLPKGFDDDALIVIERPGAIIKYGAACPYPEEFIPPIAFGAGGEMATGAMLAGATAPEAVRLVAERCNHTGGNIQIVDIAQALGLSDEAVKEAAK